jgi:hypothetical protein
MERKSRRHSFLQNITLISLGFALICSVVSAPPDIEKTCEYGLFLHGRGQWGNALELFTELVVADLQSSLQKDNFEIVDCIFGAALSLNALGQFESSLAAFRLSQRLQALHPAGSQVLAEEPQQACRSYAVFAVLLQHPFEQAQ